jgi:hypothetical protein
MSECTGRLRYRPPDDERAGPVAAGTDSGAENGRALFSGRPRADSPTRNVAGSSPETAPDLICVDLEIGVREPQDVGSDINLAPDLRSTPAHPLKRVIAQLSPNWRVTDDPLQWILERRKGNPRKKNFGWRKRSFCRTREGLLRCVREYCGQVDNDALAQLQGLPDYHPDWEPLEIAGRT